MNELSLARRIYANLNWAHAVSDDPVLGPAARPMDVWSQLQAVWRAPDREFVENLYLILLCRPADPRGLDGFCGALAGGMSRADLVRTVAQSEEARKSRLDLSWLPRLPRSPRRPFALRLLRAAWQRLKTLRPPAAPRERV